MVRTENINTMAQRVEGVNGQNSVINCLHWTGLNQESVAMFRIIITTDEYHEAQRVSSAFLVWHIEYRTRADAANAAARLSSEFSIPDSPTRYITTTRIIEVDHA
ncbi:hypothetical protein GZC45_002296 [Salmonella enterica]|nr:hypothetical protein [Salmonella enterica]